MSESEGNEGANAAALVQWGKDNRELKECLGWIHQTKDREPLDICLPWPKIADDRFYAVCGLYIGFALPGDLISPNQRRSLQYLISAGYEARIAWSVPDGVQIIKEYLGLEGVPANASRKKETD